MNLDTSHKKIWQITDKKEKQLLRKTVAPFDFSAYSQKDIDALVLHMRQMMVASRGVGLSANQIGLDMNVFVAQLPSDDGKGYQGKCYAVFNGSISNISQKEEEDIEGCLSVPGQYGVVPRATKIVVKGFDKRGRPVTIKAKGYLARIFQHEIDHLNGKVFLDRAKKIEELNNE
jgi:peptide deformylase